MGKITLDLPYDLFVNANQNARAYLKITLSAFLKAHTLSLAALPNKGNPPDFNTALDDPWAELVHESLGSATRVNAGDVLKHLGVNGVKANHQRLGWIMIALGWQSSRSSTIPGRRIYRKGKLSTRAR